MQSHFIGEGPAKARAGKMGILPIIASMARYDKFGDISCGMLLTDKAPCLSF